MTTYPNFWPGWEQDVLKAAGLPVTAANVTFLANWHQYEGSAAANNPLNVTAYKPVPVTVGYQTLNGDGVQYYKTSGQGAQATAAFLKMPNFSALNAALASGDPYNYAAKSNGNLQDVINGLATWGSHNFAAVFAYEAPQPPGSIKIGPVQIPTTGPVRQSNTNPDTGKSVQTTTTPPDSFSGLETWITNTGKLFGAYVLVIGVAGALIVTGLKGLGAPTPKLPGVPA